MTEPILSKITGQCHPACRLLPEMTEVEFRELVEDIKVNGQRNPIMIDDAGLILDGRHRWKACREAGIEPRTLKFRRHDDWHGEVTEEHKVAMIMSENIYRRHLTVQQRAAIAAELADQLAAAAKERQKTGKAAPAETKGRATAQAAKMVGGVSRTSVDNARKRMREDPEAHEQAKAGTLKRKSGRVVKFSDKVAEYEAEKKAARKQARPTVKGPSLLDAIGRMVAFTPATARAYLDAHPEDVPKIKGMIGSANRVLEALTELLTRPKKAGNE